MRDMLHKNEAKIDLVTARHEECCRRLGEITEHISDSTVHIDRDMWRELNDRLKSIEEYIRNRH